MDNLEWQLTALRKKNLIDLYKAKCSDLSIAQDKNQFE